MTAYAITGTSPEIFVVNGMGEVISGPYKNDESAKRRIRDLKRKDAAAIVASDTANEMARDDHPRGPRPSDVAERDEREAEAEINSDMLIPTKAAKLAMSSAYGKFDIDKRPLADKLAVAAPNALLMVESGNIATVRGTFPAPSRIAPTGDKHPAKPARTAGVYPHVSKNEYRRRWNYA